MEKIILDPALQSKLHGGTTQLQLCGPDGRPVAYVVPADLYGQLLSAWANEVFGDAQELEKARQEVRSQGGVSGAEILAHLASLGRAASDKP
jgi:hypothetical protein